MTKIQMKNEALALLTEHKANKKFTESMTALLEAYTASAKKDTFIREKLITMNGVELQWCNRHEVYEVTRNFKNDKSPECKLAAKHWGELGKQVKALNDKLMAKALEGEDIQEIAVELKELREIRAGRFDMAGNVLQYADVAGYDYDAIAFTDEDIQA